MQRLAAVVYLPVAHFVTGGIFDSKTSDEALMFKYAINKANKEMPPGYALTYDIQEITDDDSFTISKISKAGRQLVHCY